MVYNVSVTGRSGDSYIGITRFKPGDVVEFAAGYIGLILGVEEDSRAEGLVAYYTPWLEVETGNLCMATPEALARPYTGEVTITAYNRAP